jgi:hypothetical protein
MPGPSTSTELCPPCSDRGVACDVGGERSGPATGASLGGDSPLASDTVGGKKTCARVPRRSTLTVWKGRGKGQAPNENANL